MTLGNISNDHFKVIKQAMENMEGLHANDSLDFFHQFLNHGFKIEIEKEDFGFKQLFRYCFKFVEEEVQRKKQENMIRGIELKLLDQKITDLKNIEDKNEKKRKLDELDEQFTNDLKKIKNDLWTNPQSFCVLIIFITFCIFRKAKKLGGSQRK